MDMQGSYLEASKTSETETPVAADALGVSALVNSGWMADNNASNHRVEYRHGLGTVPRLVTIWFSPEPGGALVYPVIWPWSSAHSGNPVTIRVTDQYVYLDIWAGAPLHGVWDAGPGTWTYYSSGYWRIFAFA